jgi:hypothetical protein
MFLKKGVNMKDMAVLAASIAFGGVLLYAGSEFENRLKENDCYETITDECRWTAVERNAAYFTGGIFIFVGCGLVPFVEWQSQRLECNMNRTPTP